MINSSTEFIYHPCKFYSDSFSSASLLADFPEKQRINTSSFSWKSAKAAQKLLRCQKSNVNYETSERCTSWNKKDSEKIFLISERRSAFDVAHRSKHQTCARLVHSDWRITTRTIVERLNKISTKEACKQFYET